MRHAVKQSALSIWRFGHEASRIAANPVEHAEVIVLTGTGPGCAILGQEPPPEEIEYSDDEAEAEARRKLKQSSRRAQTVEPSGKQLAPEDIVDAEQATNAANASVTRGKRERAGRGTTGDRRFDGMHGKGGADTKHAKATKGLGGTSSQPAHAKFGAQHNKHSPTDAIQLYPKSGTCSALPAVSGPYPAAPCRPWQPPPYPDTALPRPPHHAVLPEHQLPTYGYHAVPAPHHAPHPSTGHFVGPPAPQQQSSLRGGYPANGHLAYPTHGPYPAPGPLHTFAPPAPSYHGPVNHPPPGYAGSYVPSAQPPHHAPTGPYCGMSYPGMAHTHPPVHGSAPVHGNQHRPMAPWPPPHPFPHPPGAGPL